MNYSRVVVVRYWIAWRKSVSLHGRVNGCGLLAGCVGREKREREMSSTFTSVANSPPHLSFLQTFTLRRKERHTQNQGGKREEEDRYPQNPGPDARTCTHAPSPAVYREVVVLGSSLASQVVEGWVNQFVHTHGHYKFCPQITLSFLIN